MTTVAPATAALTAVPPSPTSTTTLPDGTSSSVYPATVITQQPAQRRHHLHITPTAATHQQQQANGQNSQLQQLLHSQQQHHHHHQHQQQQQPGSKIVVLWSAEDGRAQTSVKPGKQVSTTTGSSGGGLRGGGAAVGGDSNPDGAGWKPLPFQYQIPINKYSTLHNIAVKRSAFKRRESDLASHRATIAIPKSLFDTSSSIDANSSTPATSTPHVRQHSSEVDDVDYAEVCVAVTSTSPTEMTSSTAMAEGSSTTISNTNYNNNNKLAQQMQQQQQQQLTVDTTEMRHSKTMNAIQPSSSKRSPSPSVTASMSADELRKRVELLDEKNAMTDMVIRQLSDQIARLQQQQPNPPPQPPSVHSTAATASATNSPAGGSPVKSKATTSTRQAQQPATGASSSSVAVQLPVVPEKKDAEVQVDLGWSSVDRSQEESNVMTTSTTSTTSKARNLLDTNSKLSTDYDGDADETVADCNQNDPEAIQDRLLTCRLREATMLGHLRDYRRQIEELGFQREMNEAQITRLNDELARLRQVIVECRGKEKESQSLITDLQMTLADLQHRFDEQTMLSQLRDVENNQATDDLQRKITQLENEKHRLISALQSTGAAGYYAIAHCINSSSASRLARLRNRRRKTRWQNNDSSDYSDLDENDVVADDFEDDDEDYMDQDDEDFLGGRSAGPTMRSSARKASEIRLPTAAASEPEMTSSRNLKPIALSSSLTDVRSASGRVSKMAVIAGSSIDKSDRLLAELPISPKAGRARNTSGNKLAPAEARNPTDSAAIGVRAATEGRQRVSFYVTSANCDEKALRTPQTNSNLSSTEPNTVGDGLNVRNLGHYGGGGGEMRRTPRHKTQVHSDADIEQQVTAEVHLLSDARPPRKPLNDRKLVNSMSSRNSTFGAEGSLQLPVGGRSRRASRELVGGNRRLATNTINGQRSQITMMTSSCEDSDSSSHERTVRKPGSDAKSASASAKPASSNRTRAHHQSVIAAAAAAENETVLFNGLE